MSLRTEVRRMWLAVRRETTLLVPYEVACSCGASLRGRRRRRHQVVPCPSCGQAVFILARSPWPPPARAPGDARGRSPLDTWGAGLARREKTAPAFTTPAAPTPSRAVWRGPLIAGTCTAAVLLLLLAALVWRLGRPESLGMQQPASSEGILRRMEAGQRALAEGNFRLALGELNSAIEGRDRRPEALTAAQNRRLVQLQRQSDLLARLLSRSLEEILEQATRLREDAEWQAQFSDYRDKTVLFEDVVYRDAAGRPVLESYVVRAGRVRARVALEDLELLQMLTLDSPQRLLFGARLARCAREQGGTWVIRFEPDSGVLLTDPGAAAACCPAPLGPDLVEVLHRQQQWINDLAGQQPLRSHEDRR